MCCHCVPEEEGEEGKGRRKLRACVCVNQLAECPAAIDMEMEKEEKNSLWVSLCEKNKESEGIFL